VALVKIFTLLHEYQTLVREIATPNLPGFVTACLQLIKPTASRPLKVPLSFVNVIACALSQLVPLYPTTLRPFNGQIRTAFRGYLAPTLSDAKTVPHRLSRSARRLVILLHYSAPKNSSSEEWETGIRGYLGECHATANQIFRAVKESWESSAGYNAASVSLEGEPSGGGGDSSEGLPSWTGIQAGSDRLAGLLGFLGDYFQCPTKSPVSIPLGELVDLTSRITLITPPSVSSSSSYGRDDGMELQASISRDEKDELWTVLPSVQMAVLQLHVAMLQRLKHNALPLASELLNQVVQVFKPNRSDRSMREIVYSLVGELLHLNGPTLDKMTVESLVPIVQHCCRDILEASGHLQSDKPAPALAATGGANGRKGQGATGNADAFLTPDAGQNTRKVSLGHEGVTTARNFLTTVFSRMPQAHLSPETRGLLDRTAILAGSKDAMLASCLYPYKDSNGRYYPSILPFLVRQFPTDQAVEVLRSNLRSGGKHTQDDGWDASKSLEDLVEKQNGWTAEGDEQGMELDLPLHDVQGRREVMEDLLAGAADTDMKNASNNKMKTKTSESVGWEAMTTPAVRPSTNGQEVSSVTLKRKADNTEPANPKRVDKGQSAEVAVEIEISKPLPSRQDTPAVVRNGSEDGDGDSDSDSDLSIQIDMTLDDDEDENEEVDDDI
jgi:pre-rRNA-processing protein RIX1